MQQTLTRDCLVGPHISEDLVGLRGPVAKTIRTVAWSAPDSGGYCGRKDHELHEYF